MGMSKYNLKFLKQEKGINGRFETLEVKNAGDNHTWNNIQTATSNETLRFFRRV